MEENHYIIIIIKKSHASLVRNTKCLQYCQINTTIAPAPPKIGKATQGSNQRLTAPLNSFKNQIQRLGDHFTFQPKQV